MDDVARPCVGLVADLARDRDEKPALDVQHALRPPGRADVYVEQVRVLGVDGERLQLARAVGEQLVEWGEHHVLERGASRRASSSVESIGISRPRRSEVLVVIATLASESARRCATAGAAKPEKTGTCTAPMCAHACEATAASGDMGR